MSSTASLKKNKEIFPTLIRYTAKIGLISLQNPEFTVEEIKDSLEAQVDYEDRKVLKLIIEES